MSETPKSDDDDEHDGEYDISRYLSSDTVHSMGSDHKEDKRTDEREPNGTGTQNIDGHEIACCKKGNVRKRKWK